MANIVVNNGRNILTFDCETGLIIHTDNIPGWAGETTEEYKKTLVAAMDFRNPVRSTYIAPEVTPRNYAENIIPRYA